MTTALYQVVQRGDTTHVYRTHTIGERYIIALCGRYLQARRWQIMLASDYQAARVTCQRCQQCLDGRLP